MLPHRGNGRTSHSRQATGPTKIPTRPKLRITVRPVRLVLTTEDGSAGESGRITAPLDRELSIRPPDHRVMIYACGPEGMLAATAKTAARFHRPCQVSVERIMGCGLGGCYSCVVPILSNEGRVHHVRSCLAGPVLAADRIVWD